MGSVPGDRTRGKRRCFKASAGAVLSCPVDFVVFYVLPAARKYAIVKAIPACVSPGGKVAFIDYPAPAPRHPWRGAVRQIIAHTERFAQDMRHHDIANFAGNFER